MVIPKIATNYNVWNMFHTQTRCLDSDNHRNHQWRGGNSWNWIVLHHMFWSHRVLFKIRDDMWKNIRNYSWQKQRNATISKSQIYCQFKWKHVRNARQPDWCQWWPKGIEITSLLDGSYRATCMLIWDARTHHSLATIWLDWHQNPNSYKLTHNFRDIWDVFLKKQPNEFTFRNW